MARNRYYEDEQTEVFKGRFIRRLLSYLLPYKTKLFWGITVMLTVTALMTALPYIAGLFVDHIYPQISIIKNETFSLGLGLPDYYASTYIPKALLLACSIGAIYVLTAIFTALRGVILNTVGQYAIYDLRKHVFSHLQKLSFSYFDSRPAGKILIRVTAYIDALAGLLTSGVVSLISETTIVLVIMAVMFSLDSRLALVSLGATIPLLIVSYIFKKVLRPKWDKFRNARSNRTAYIHENIMGLFITQAFNREERNFKEHQRLDTELLNIFNDLVLTRNLIHPSVEFINTACIIAVYVAGFWLITQNSVSPGNLFTFAMYIPMFWGPINNIMNIFNELVTAMSNMEKIFETLDTEPDITDKPNAKDMPSIKGNITFENVTFHYGDGNNILENVSFDVPAGSTIALVGPTGAGKTTVVNLIPRFYDVTGGRILIDGMDVRDVKLHSLRRQIGVMMQDSFIFTGTIMDNIRYARPDATDEECIAAAKKVYAHDFIMKLKKGYQTELGERGAGLSAGEKQLISFARTILTDPKILILDEATANIDTETEIIIQNALASMLQGRTSFIIAHRLSTIRKADRIMYVANKGIAESGSHSELMKAKGKYYELCMTQFKAV